MGHPVDLADCRFVIVPKLEYTEQNKLLLRQHTHTSKRNKEAHIEKLQVLTRTSVLTMSNGPSENVANSQYLR